MVKGKEIKMAADGSGKDKVSFRLRDLLSLLNKWLERGVVFNQNLLVKVVALKKRTEHSCSESECAS